MHTVTVFRTLLLAVMASVLFVLTPAYAASGGQMDMSGVQRTAADWLETQLNQGPNPGTYTFGKVDARLRLEACERMDVQVAPGYRLAGKSMLRVRCVQGASWAVNLPVAISVQATYYVAARPLAAGHTLTEGDLNPATGDLGALPGSVVLDPNEALGRTLATAVAAGAPVRNEMLRAALVIQQGQKVRVTYRSDTLEISNDGVALNNASAGQTVRVRIGQSTIVQGLARDGGLVEVTE